MLDMSAGRGCIAFNHNEKTLGLITGGSSHAWKGIHLTDKVAPIGSPWSATYPIIVGHVLEFRLPYDEAVKIIETFCKDALKSHEEYLRANRAERPVVVNLGEDENNETVQSGKRTPRRGTGQAVSKEKPSMDESL